MAGRTERDRMERERRRSARAYAVRRAVHEERIGRRRRDNRLALVAFVVLLAAAGASQVGYFVAGPGAPRPTASGSAAPTPAPSATPSPSPSRTLPPESAAEDRTWKGTMTLNGTALSITLNGRKAPQAVANFVTLARSGFYTGLGCHRLTTTGLYVLQCGDPRGDGTGGPGYTFGPLENVPADGEYGTGDIAMARGSAEDSQGSQFFIVYRTSTLPAPGYTVLGRVTGGLGALRTAVIDAGNTGTAADTPKVATTIRGVDLR